MVKAVRSIHLWEMGCPEAQRQQCGCGEKSGWRSHTPGRVGPEALPSFLGVRKNVVSFHGHKLGKPLYGGIVREQSTAAASLVSRTCWSHQLPALLRRSLHTRVTLLSVENTSGDRLSFCWGDSEAC